MLMERKRSISEQQQAFIDYIVKENKNYIWLASTLSENKDFSQVMAILKKNIIEKKEIK